MEDIDLKDLQSVLDELKPGCEARVSEGFKERVMHEARRHYFPERKRSFRLKNMHGVWSAAAMVAVVCSVAFLALHSNPLSANSLLELAIENLCEVRSLQMEIDIRTHKAENFYYLSPDEEFVPHTISVSYDEPVRWRIDKADSRSAFGNDEEIYTWINQLKIGTCFKGEASRALDYLATLLQPHHILQRELNGSLQNDETEYHIKNSDDEIILSVHARPQGEYKPDGVMLNKSIESSENVRCYTFDRKSKRLTHFQICMVIGGREVEVLRTRSIRYNADIDRDALLQIPEEIHIEPQTEPKGTGKKLVGIPPREAARLLLSAFEQWEEELLDEALGYAVVTAVKQGYQGSRLLEVGEPFREGKMPFTFVPYKLRMPDGRIQEGNLSLTPQKNGGWKCTGGF